MAALLEKGYGEEEYALRRQLKRQKSYENKMRKLEDRGRRQKAKNPGKKVRIIQFDDAAELYDY